MDLILNSPEHSTEDPNDEDFEFIVKSELLTDEEENPFENQKEEDLMSSESDSESLEIHEDSLEIDEIENLRVTKYQKRRSKQKLIKNLPIPDFKDVEDI